MSDAGYETVVGIECHVELKTVSKMFCGCRNVFGGEPNTNVCPVCLALPGALPVPNGAAIEHIVRAGLAFGATIPRFSKFDRKNYFYPDMPKNYQISQYDLPLAQGGTVAYTLPDGTPRECRLTRIHLEEDTGKSSHAGSTGRIGGSTHSLIDFNRAGVPLMECVSEPGLRSAHEAVAFLETLKRTFVELEISDVKMEEGSLRCDANVSVRRRGASMLGTKTEIKNMNSFRSVQRAIEHEAARQIAVLEAGGRIVQETRGWDEAGGTSYPMRSKEEAHDYRYFPEPDLVPLELDEEQIERLRAGLPELPATRRARYAALGISGAQSAQLLDNPALARYYEECLAKGADAQAALNFVLGDLSRLANESGTPVYQSGVTPERLRELLGLLADGTINSKLAKSVLARVWKDGESPKLLVRREGMSQTSDSAALDKFIDPVLESNPKSVADFKAGKENALKFLMGQVMKASRGQANPVAVETRLRGKLR